MARQVLDRVNPAVVPQTVGDNVERGSGRLTVMYRNLDGKSLDAIVIGPGSVSGLKLEIPSLRGLASGAFILDNVAAATTMKSVNAYFTFSSFDLAVV